MTDLDDRLRAYLDKREAEDAEGATNAAILSELREHKAEQRACVKDAR